MLAALSQVPPVQATTMRLVTLFQELMIIARLAVPMITMLLLLNAIYVKSSANQLEMVSILVQLVVLLASLYVILILFCDRPE